MASLQSLIKTTLGWCYSLGGKFVRVVPFTTLTVQAAHLFSQVLLLLTFFLPLKVLILLGSEKIPHYFPLYLQNLKKTHLIIAFSVLALICYVLYVIACFVISYYSKRGANKLLKNSAKLSLFDNQRKIAAQAYSKFTRGLAAGTFVAIVFVILLFIYPSLVFVVLLYSAAAGSALIALYNRKPTVRKLIQLHHSDVLTTLSSIGFLIAFFCMVADYLYFNPPKIFAALIALLLLRQGLSRLTTMIQDVISLRSQYRQINAMFFHDKPLVSTSSVYTPEIKRLLTEDSRKAWMAEAMTSLQGDFQRMVSSAWSQLAQPNIYSFEAVFSNDDGEQKKFLFKLFDSSTVFLAKRERVLLQNMTAIPSLRFVGATTVHEFNCHVFECDGFRKVLQHEQGPGLITLARKLMSLEPEEGLVQQFGRSHTYLEQRLTEELLANFCMVVSKDNAPLVRQFQHHYAGIVSLIAGLPRQLVCTDINPNTLLLSDSGEACASHWPNWKIEPTGANWLVIDRVKFLRAINQAKASRESLADVPSAAIMVCALAYAFERLCARGSYDDALALLPDLLEHFQSLETTTAE